MKNIDDKIIDKVSAAIIVFPSMIRLTRNPNKVLKNLIKEKYSLAKKDFIFCVII